LASGGSQDGRIAVWDVKTQKLLVQIQRRVEALAFHPDGKKIATASCDREVRLIDIVDQAPDVVFNGHEHWSTCVNFSPEGTRIVSGSRDRTVRLWDIASGQQLLVLHGHEDYVDHVAFSTDGRRVASACKDTVRLWDAETGECLAIHPGTSDALSVAEGPAEHPFAVFVRGLETDVEDVRQGKVIAGFHVNIEHITTHPTGVIWAGTIGNHLAFLKLEGIQGN